MQRWFFILAPIVETSGATEVYVGGRDMFGHCSSRKMPRFWLDPKLLAAESPRVPGTMTSIDFCHGLGARFVGV